mmetsp:Transcript_1654/g.3560  ORF Transcript_1654/g.3560 Transcript_1654/m.3560 type:complete len:174 (-) Transcript_1654:36-557(-)
METRGDLKLVIFGGTGVGKTNIVTRYVHNTFNFSTDETIGATCVSKTATINRNLVKLQIWDLAGQSRCRSLAPMYIRDANGLLGVFDLTNKSSLDDIEAHSQIITHYRLEATPKVLVGNKSDLEHLRQVSFEEGQQFAEAHRMLYVETSALSSTNIEQAINTLATLMLTRRND